MFLPIRNAVVSLLIRRSRDIECDPYVADRARDIAAAIRETEGATTVNGRSYSTTSIADRARQQLARRLAEAEQHFNGHCYHMNGGCWVNVRYDALAGVATLEWSVTITIRVLRCASCGELLPVGTVVTRIPAGVIGDLPHHLCHQRHELLRQFPEHILTGRIAV